MTEELVIMRDRQAVTTSLQIAENFEKKHQHVLRDIDALKQDVSNFGQMFFDTEIPDSYGRPQRAYLMNRDGFTLLAMGFTGKEALEWKVKYINAFNAMEQELRNPKPMTANEMFSLQAQINLDNEREIKELKGRTAENEKRLDETNRKFDAVTTFVTSPLTDADT